MRRRYVCNQTKTSISETPCFEIFLLLGGFSSWCFNLVLSLAHQLISVFWLAETQTFRHPTRKPSFGTCPGKSTDFSSFIFDTLRETTILWDNLPMRSSEIIINLEYKVYYSLVEYTEWIESWSASKIFSSSDGNNGAFDVVLQLDVIQFIPGTKCRQFQCSPWIYQWCVGWVKCVGGLKFYFTSFLDPILLLIDFKDIRLSTSSIIDQSEVIMTSTNEMTWL